MIVYRKIAALLSALMILFTLSCEDQIFPIVDCNNCLTEEPSSAEIIVRVNLDDNIFYFNTITINVYEGDNVTGEKIYWYSPTDEITTINVALNRTYTIEAVYRMSDYTYKAIDSAKPTVKYTDTACEEPCWFVYNNKVNLRLKYR